MIHTKISFDSERGGNEQPQCHKNDEAGCVSGSRGPPQADLQITSCLRRAS